MLNSSQTFRKYFCPPLFSELESCAVVCRIVRHLLISVHEWQFTGYGWPPWVLIPTQCPPIYDVLKLANNRLFYTPLHLCKHSAQIVDCKTRPSDDGVYYYKRIRPPKATIRKIYIFSFYYYLQLSYLKLGVIQQLRGPDLSLQDRRRNVGHRIQYCFSRLV